MSIFFLIPLSIHQFILFLGVFCDNLQTTGCMSVSISASLPWSNELYLFTALFFGYNLYIQWNTPIFFPHSFFLIEVCNIALTSALEWLIYTHVCVYIHCVHINIYNFYYYYYFLLIMLQGMWGQFPDQGLKPQPLQWKCGVLTTGPPRVPHIFFFILFSNMFYHRILNIVLCALL